MTTNAMATGMSTSDDWFVAGASTIDNATMRTNTTMVGTMVGESNVLFGVPTTVPTNSVRAWSRFDDCVAGEVVVSVGGGADGCRGDTVEERLVAPGSGVADGGFSFGTAPWFAAGSPVVPV